MILKDERTEELKRAPHLIVMGTDKVLSGWGGAKGGPSFAGWACRPEEQAECERWVRSRSDMKRVRIVWSDYRPPSGPGHCHIYVWKGER